MKIRKLSIKNYKVFDDVEFDFTDAEGKTLDTVVLAGTNGCGKTTVLELLSTFLTHSFSSNHLTREVRIEFEFNEKEVERGGSKHIFLADPDPIKKQFVRTNRATFDVAHTDFHTFEVFTGTQTVGSYFPVKTITKNGNTDLLKIGLIDRDLPSVKDQALKIVRDEVFKNKNLPPQQVIEQQIKRLNQALEGLDLNTRLVDLESEELIFESTNGQRIYFEQLSHGEQHLYFRALYLSQLNLQDGLILVDEPEAAFHPTWQQKVARLYRNVGHNNQVFLATHSPHIMASVPPECLFLLHIDEKTHKVSVVNAAKAGLHSEGLEPNRILKELMQVATLREYETQRDIDRLSELLTLADFESPEALSLAEKLTQQLGRQDPFILRLEHQQLMLRRKKETLAPA